MYGMRMELQAIEWSGGVVSPRNAPENWMVADAETTPCEYRVRGLRPGDASTAGVATGPLH